MAVAVTFNSSGYLIPSVGDEDWGASVSDLLIDLANSAVTSTANQTIGNKVIRLQAGTAGAPALAFSADTATGLYQPAAGQLAISTAGVQRLLVTAAGQVTVANLNATGGAINGVQLGTTTPASGVFTTLQANSSGGWSSYNYGRNFTASVRTPNSCNPALGLTDALGNNPWAIANRSGVLCLSTMPVFTNSTTPPTDVLLLYPSQVWCNKVLSLASALQMTNNTAIQWRNSSGTYQNAVWVGSDNALNLVNPGSRVRMLNQAQNVELLGVDNTGNVTVGASLTAPGALRVQPSSGAGGAVLSPGNPNSGAIPYPGYAAFYGPNLTTRYGYAGFNAYDGNSWLTLGAENGFAGWYTNLSHKIGQDLLCQGVVRAGTAINSSFYLYQNADAALINFNDTNCRLVFTKADQRLSLLNGSGTRLWSADSAGTTTQTGDANIQGVARFHGFQEVGSTSAYVTPAGFQNGPWAVGVSAISDQAICAPVFVTFSDRRSKQDITDITTAEALAWVQAARPRRYLVNGRPSAGFVAQEDIQSGRGEAVLAFPDDDPIYAEPDGEIPAKTRLIRDYQHDIPYLTGALQAALTKIEALTQRVAALEADIG